MSIRQRAVSRTYPLPRARTKARTASLPRAVVLIIAGAVLLSGLCLLYLWQGTAILSLTAERESAKQTLASIQEVNRYLEFQVDRAFSLERIERIARTQLGMDDPEIVRYVEVPGK